MTLEDYEASKKNLLDLALSIEVKKRPDYTIGNVDVHHNFKSVAARVGITPEQAWAVYFLKHVDAICSFIGGNTNPSEPIEQRFADLINYGKLGYSLIEEGQVLEGAK